MAFGVLWLFFIQKSKILVILVRMTLFLIFWVCWTVEVNTVSNIVKVIIVKIKNGRKNCPSLQQTKNKNDFLPFCDLHAL